MIRKEMVISLIIIPFLDVGGFTSPQGPPYALPAEARDPPLPSGRSSLIAAFSIVPISSRFSAHQAPDPS
jgi:hypothetical protein